MLGLALVIAVVLSLLSPYFLTTKNLLNVLDQSVVIGIVSVAWPNITIGAFVILFAVYAFVLAVTDAFRAFSSDAAGPVFGYLFLALIAVVAGVTALAWPGVPASPVARSVTLPM